MSNLTKVKPLFCIFLCKVVWCKHLCPHADWALENNTKGNLFSFPLKSVGYELSSRVVSNQVFSPLQRLTSVFGMGTGGPTAFI